VGEWALLGDLQPTVSKKRIVEMQEYLLGKGIEGEKV
jgi:hypothetical protein